MNSLLLLGAGASYGSDLHNTPPLGKDLADALCVFNPEGWGALSQNQILKFKTNFEQGMVNLGEDNPHCLAILQRAMASYFFGFLPRTTNLYVRLAQLMKDANWAGAICTLNYERYAELCALHVGLQPSFEPTIAGKTVEFCFPHGCCHFFCDAVTSNSQLVSFDGFNVQTNGNIQIIHDRKKFNEQIHNDAFPPVMSYFEPNKRTTSGVNLILGQRQRFKELILKADKIIIIGARVRTHDIHIWEPMKETSAKIIYCGGKDGGADFVDWAKSERPGNFDVSLDGYFDDKFESIVEELGLQITEYYKMGY